MFKNKYGITKKEENEQEIKLLTGSLLHNFVEKKKIRLIAVSTTCCDKDTVRGVMSAIEDCAGVSRVFKTDNFDDCIGSDAAVWTGDDKELVLIGLKPLRLSADSVELAKKCGGIVLVEKYGTTLYAEFERTLSIAKENDIPVLGVIALK